MSAAHAPQLAPEPHATFNRKVRIVLDWTLALFFPRDVISIGSLTKPRQEFAEVARRPEKSP